MRQLRTLLTFAARTLANTPASGAFRDPLHLHGARAAAAAAASGRHAGLDARNSWPSPLLGLASFATDDGPAHRGEREQLGATAAQDRQQLAEEWAASEALSGADPTDAAAAAASAEARSQPGDAAATDAQAADAATAADADLDADVSLVEAELAKLGFKSGGGKQDRDGLEPVDISQLASSSDSEDGDVLALPSSDEDDDDEADADEKTILERAFARRAKEAAAKAAGAQRAGQPDEDEAGQQGSGGEGVLAAEGRKLSLLEEIQQASKKRQRFLLQQQLRGGDERSQNLAEELRPPQTGDFNMKVVDVNRTSKGARAGRVQGFSALVVVGNQNGILGQGSGKALEAKAAVDKATRKALKHLTYVPRFRDHTIHYPITVLYGKTKLIMYPRASARGIKASNLMNALCRLAGIKDVGIKIQGSRNLRNSVQALFKAFDQMQTRVDEDSVDATPYPVLPPRFRMEKPAPPKIRGMEDFDWDRLIDEVLVEQEPVQMGNEEAPAQQAATA